MATKVARGKALVAKLRADPQVRDAEALAAYLGRVKRLKKGGLSTKAAIKAAGKAAKGAAPSKTTTQTPLDSVRRTPDGIDAPIRDWPLPHLEAAAKDSRRSAADRKAFRAAAAKRRREQEQFSRPKPLPMTNERRGGSGDDYWSNILKGYEQQRSGSRRKRKK